MGLLSPLFDQEKPSAFTSIAGITNGTFAQYTDGSQHIYTQILKIFDLYCLDYYLFAGSMVGYVRNGEMPCWMDDLDVIIFEDQISLFEGKVVPHLLGAGFNTFFPENLKGSGYHILSLQSGKSRNIEIEFSKGVGVKVPWAQIDVFYAKIDDSGFVRNPKGWGLYHAKDIPVTWVKPGTFVDILGRRIKVFSEYEMDILKEYGDVLNNLVVSTHDKTFLRIDNVPWSDVEAEIREIRSTTSQLPSSITREQVSNYVPNSDKTFLPKSDDTFESILNGILEIQASTVVLSFPMHLFWVMDIKRILPKISVRASIADESVISRATHLRAFYDLIVGENQQISEKIDAQLKYLEI